MQGPLLPRVFSELCWFHSEPWGHLFEGERGMSSMRTLTSLGQGLGFLSEHQRKVVISYSEKGSFPPCVKSLPMFFFFLSSGQIVTWPCKPIIPWKKARGRNSNGYYAQQSLLILSCSLPDIMFQKSQCPGCSDTKVKEMPFSCCDCSKAPSLLVSE